MGSEGAGTGRGRVDALWKGQANLWGCGGNWSVGRLAIGQVRSTILTVGGLVAAGAGAQELRVKNGSVSRVLH